MKRWNETAKEYHEIFDTAATWSREEVEEEDRLWLADGGEERWGRLRPQLVWRSIRRVRSCEARFEEGEPLALFEAILECSRFGIPLPYWARTALQEAYSRAKNFEVRTLDEAFGYKLPANIKISKLRKKHVIGHRLFCAVTRRNKLNGDGISDDLFAAVGELFAISGSAAKQLYYEVKDDYAKRGSLKYFERSAVKPCEMGKWRTALFNKVTRRNKLNGEALTELLFARVGLEFRIEGSDAKQLYHEVKDELAKTGKLEMAERNALRLGRIPRT
jgi:hypothetical protein